MSKKEAFVLALASALLGAFITIAVIKPVGKSESYNILNKEGTLITNGDRAMYYSDCSVNTEELKALSVLSEMYSSTILILSDEPVNASDE